MRSDKAKEIDDKQIGRSKIYIVNNANENSVY